jgi:hypothetical protein
MPCDRAPPWATLDPEQLPHEDHSRFRRRLDHGGLSQSSPLYMTVHRRPHARPTLAISDSSRQGAVSYSPLILSVHLATSTVTLHSLGNNKSSLGKPTLSLESIWTGRDGANADEGQVACYLSSPKLRQLRYSCQKRDPLFVSVRGVARRVGLLR